MMNRMKTDVLVIGGGAAGIRAAIEASDHGAEVTLINKTEITASGASFSQISRGWGIQALVGNERTPDNKAAFLNDIIRVSHDVCDRELAQILVEESGDRFDDLQSYGIEFRKQEDGKFFRATGCFSDSKRAFLTSDFENIKKTFLAALRQRPVIIVTGTVIDLCIVDSTCCGAVLFTDSYELVFVQAISTILANGGGAGIFMESMADEKASGDGYALAARAGAQLCNMEFIQFMLGLKVKDQPPSFFPIHQLFKAGALVDPEGNDILEGTFSNDEHRNKIVSQRQHHGPFSTCDASYAIDAAVKYAEQAKGVVYLGGNANASGNPKVTHMAHAYNGGVVINSSAESTVPGLFAAGEVAAGMHGADRIGGCMMTATQVFGRRAGYYAARRSKCRNHPAISRTEKQPLADLDSSRSAQADHCSLKSIEKKIRLTMQSYAGVVRTEHGLKSCLVDLDGVKHQLKKMVGTSGAKHRHYLKVRNMEETARIVVQAALKRKFSLGPHFRKDTVCHGLK